MMTSSSPCFFHSSRMYSASSLLRLDPAMWGSWVKMRCWRRSSSGVGMDLNLDSTAVSRAAEAVAADDDVFESLLFPLVANVLREFVVAFGSGDVGFLGEDAVLAALFTQEP